MALIEVLGRTGGVLKTHHMHESPEVTEQKHGDRPELVIDKVPLVTVDNEYLLLRFLMLQYQGFYGPDALQKLHPDLIILVIKLIEVVPDKVFILKIDIMIAVKHNKTAVIVELLNHLEDIAVGQTDMLEILMLPEFISVPGLHINISHVVIVVQSME